mmetsp:Transcript_29861/g.95545  ORF Transcript_29861/g.95545 Transcript_29861/m.95545 type:complete len:239 (-) Transcript_29861:1472-2188(-)
MRVQHKGGDAAREEVGEGKVEHALLGHHLDHGVDHRRTSAAHTLERKLEGEARVHRHHHGDHQELEQRPLAHDVEEHEQRVAQVRPQYLARRPQRKRGEQELDEGLDAGADEDEEGERVADGAALVELEHRRKDRESEGVDVGQRHSRDRDVCADDCHRPRVAVADEGGAAEHEEGGERRRPERVVRREGGGCERLAMVRRVRQRVCGLREQAREHDGEADGAQHRHERSERHQLRHE